MSTDKPTPPQPGGPATRAELIELYQALVHSLLEYMRSKPVDKLRGSMLDVIRKVLVDAGITAEVREAMQAHRALADLKDAAGDLDVFEAPFPAVEQ